MAFPHRPLFSTIAWHVYRCMGDFVPQGLANLVWAFATLLFADASLVAAIAHAATPRLPESTAQNSSNATWSFATLHSLHVPFMAAL